MLGRFICNRLNAGLTSGIRRRAGDGLDKMNNSKPGSMRCRAVRAGGGRGKRTPRNLAARLLRIQVWRPDFDLRLYKVSATDNPAVYPRQFGYPPIEQDDGAG